MDSTGQGMHHQTLPHHTYPRRWNYYSSILAEFHQKSPSYIRKVARNIQESTGWALSHFLFFLPHQQSSYPTAKGRSNKGQYNFDALKESALAEDVE